MINDASSNHRQAWDLIPWIVNGTASEAERKLAEPHIRSCADCRGEFELQRRLQLHMSSAASPELEEEQGSWQALRARLNAAVPATRAAPDPQRVRGRMGRTAWLAAAVVVQSIGLGALALVLAVRSPVAAPPAQGSSVAVQQAGNVTAAAAAGAATYHTLASPQESAPVGTIRVVFAPRMTLTQLQALLERTNLRIVSGPHEGGVWWLAPPSGEAGPNGAVRALRADPLVRFAAAGGGSP